MTLWAKILRISWVNDRTLLPSNTYLVKFIFPFISLLALLLIFQCLGCRKNPYTQGQVLYTYHCENCHMADGSGLARLIPHLDSSRLTLSDPAKLVCLIRKGLPKNPETGQEMPANKDLNEVELANLINFLGFKYGDSPQTVMVEDVKNMLAGCQSD